MTLTEKTTKTIFDARHRDPELDAALDGVDEMLCGILGTLETVAHIDPPMNDTEEHKAINSALNSLLLVCAATEAVYYGIGG